MARTRTLAQTAMMAASTTTNHQPAGVSAGQRRAKTIAHVRSIGSCAAVANRTAGASKSSSAASGPAAIIDMIPPRPEKIAFLILERDEANYPIFGWFMVSRSIMCC
jgi:hypothetical protein